MPISSVRLSGTRATYGVLALPETKLSPAVFQSATTAVIPVGQLWLRKLTPIARGSAVDTYELQMVNIRHLGSNPSPATNFRCTATT
jgi:hypothetical protein